MKLYLYAAILFAILGFGWWLREDAIKDFKADLLAAEAAHKAETERLKRVRDDVKRKLEAETRRRLDELAKIKADVCYYLDTPITDPSITRLLNPSPDKTRP